METCPKCEKIILSDYKFCPRCGYSVSGETAAGDPLQQADVQQPAVQSVSASGTDDCHIEERAVKFFNVAQDLSTAGNVDTLLKKIGIAVEEILGVERSSIMLLDETGKNLYFKIATGEEILKKLKIPVGQGIAGCIAENRKPDMVKPVLSLNPS
jgi:hypothetical protein